MGGDLCCTICLSQCTRTSLRRSVIEGNCEAWRNRRSPPPESAFPASSSTIRNSPSCTLSCASVTSPAQTTSQPPNSTLESWMPSAPDADHYTLASLRYDLSKPAPRALQKSCRTRYRLLPYSICLVFLKLFERAFASLTAGLLSPIKADAGLHSQHRSQLDRRVYQSVVDDLDRLIQARRPQSCTTAAPSANEILVQQAPGLTYRTLACAAPEIFGHCPRASHLHVSQRDA